jgi:hypothetical protein
MTVLDREGLELGDVEEAEREAERRMRDILAREAPSAGDRAIVIADDWRTVLEVPF